MAWQLVERPQHELSVYGVVKEKSQWIFRGFKDVYSWNQEINEIIWKTTLPGDDSFGYRTLVRSGGLVITAAHRNSDPHEVWLVALSLKTGDVIWERRVAWRLHKYFGGLIALEEEIVILEDLERPRLVFIDSAVGKNTFEKPEEIVPKYASSAKNVIYYSLDRKWLRKLVIAQREKGTEIVWDSDTASILSLDKYVYTLARFKEQDGNVASVIWLDGPTGNIIKKVLLPGKPRQPSTMQIYTTSLSTPQCLILKPDSAQGIAFVDFEIGDIVWHIGQEAGWNARGAVWTPAGIVVIMDKGNSCQIMTLNEIDGSCLATVKTKREPTHILYWVDGYLIVDTLSGPEIFRWEA